MGSIVTYYSVRSGYGGTKQNQFCNSDPSYFTGDNGQPGRLGLDGPRGSPGLKGLKGDAGLNGKTWGRRVMDLYY